MEDKTIIKQLANLRKEIASEEKRINEMQVEIERLRPKIREVTDIVTKGKRGKKSLGICKIHGFEDYKKINKKRVKIRERKAKKELHISQLEEMVILAEELIYTQKDSELRNIMLLYCVDQKSWDEVAISMGEGYTAEACKQKFSRFLRQK